MFRNHPAESLYKPLGVWDEHCSETLVVCGVRMTYRRARISYQGGLVLQDWGEMEPLDQTLLGLVADGERRAVGWRCR